MQYLDKQFDTFKFLSINPELVEWIEKDYLFDSLFLCQVVDFPTTAWSTARL